MRKGITKLVRNADGTLTREYDMQKIIGQCYNRAWWTNLPGIRTRIIKGARNCKKSVNLLGYEPLMKIMSDPRRNVFMIRKNDVDNRNSTYANLQRCISDLGLEHLFKSTLQPLCITYLPTGQEIKFFGLNNPTQLNSATCSTGFLTDIYIEEGFEVTSYEDFQKLSMSLRLGKEYDENGNLVELKDLTPQITIVLNAWQQDHFLYSEYFKGRLEDDIDKIEKYGYTDYCDPDFIDPGGQGLYLMTASYKINEFRSDTVDRAAKEMREKNFEYYKVIFGGCWGAAGSSVYGTDFNKDSIITQEQLKNYKFIAFALASDAGFSHAGVEKHKVLKNDDVDKIVRSATTLCLTGITENYKEIIAIDEYYHSNADPDYNTDDKEDLPMHKLADRVVEMVQKWCVKYGGYEQSSNALQRPTYDYGLLMRGEIMLYVDNMDVGFIDTLKMKFREARMFNVEVRPSSKAPIQGRVDFERIMLSYGCLKVCENCRNLIREFKIAHKDPKTGVRADGSDHILTAFEYSFLPFRSYFTLWKMNFKEH